MALATLTIDINARLANIEQDLGKVSHMAEKSAERMESAFGAAKAAFAGMAAAFSVGALMDQVKGIVDLGDQMNDLSQKVGISVKDLATWKLAAEQSGTSLESVAKGVKGLSTYMLENGDALKQAGINATDANGAMIQLADLFAAMPDGVTKTALAVKLFGKAGMDMIPMLNQGSQGLAEAQEKARAYGERMALLAPQADKFNDQLAEIQLHSKAASMTMVSNLLPAMTEISGAMAVAAQEGGALKAVWIGFGGIGAQILNPLNALIKQVGASAHELAADFNEAMARITTGNVSQNFLATALAERAQAQRIYREIAQLGTGLGLDRPGEGPAETPAQIAARIKAQQEAIRRAMVAGRLGKDGKEGGSGNSAFDRMMEQQRKRIAEINAQAGDEQMVSVDSVTRRYEKAIQDRVDAMAEAHEKRMEEIRIETEGEGAIQSWIDKTSLALKNQKSIAQDLGMTFASAAEEAIIRWQSVGDVLRGLAQDVQRIFVRKTMTEPLARGVSNFLEGSDLFKGLFSGAGPDSYNWMPSFAGGGRTGPGARSGGIDGQGGFMAVLHPNETVIDHTRANGSTGVTVVQNLNFAVGISQTVRAEVMNLMPQIQAAAQSAVLDARLRGGSARRAFKG